MVLDAPMLYFTLDPYLIRIKGKMKHTKEWSSVLPYTSV